MCRRDFPGGAGDRLVALYVGKLNGAWRWIYVVTAVMALYFNVFVCVVQAFQKVGTLRLLAPPQTEPPFAIAQAAVLLLFVVLGFIALRRFRPTAPLILRAFRILSTPT
jgi:hypothetical protein